MEQHSNDQQTGLWARLKERAAAWNDPEARQQRGRRAGQRRRLARDWARIHLRRAAHRTHGTLAIQQAVGPASFLVVSAALGVALPHRCEQRVSSRSARRRLRRWGTGRPHLQWRFLC